MSSTADWLKNPSALFDIRGKVAVVTGASGSFGSLASAVLAGAGAKLILAAGNAKALEQTAAQCRELGADVRTVQCRPGTEADCDAIMDAAIESFGTLDILVVGSGLNDPCPIVDDYHSSGEVLGKTAQRHTSAQFVQFLEEIVAEHDEDQQIHVICDNVSSHKTALVETWLLLTPNVHIHYTPTYSSWLNQVEIWFAKIQRDVIARGIFPSTKDLGKKIMRYIREHNKHSKPIRWKYANPKHRITSNLIDSVN